MKSLTVGASLLRRVVVVGVVAATTFATGASAYAAEGSELAAPTQFNTQAEDCVPPPAGSYPGSPEYQDWAVDQYVYSCLSPEEPPFASAIEALRNMPDCKGLQMGASGACVVALQVALNDAGYPVVVDGVWGPATDAAVRLLESSYNTEVNGVLDDGTLQVLGAAGDVELTEENILEHEEGHGKRFCAFLGPFGGPVCDDLLSPTPAG